MREQGGWWGEIVQKTNTRHFPQTEKKESIFESQQSDQSNKKKKIGIITKFQNAKDNEKILKASRERKSANTKEECEWHQIAQQQH